MNNAVSGWLLALSGWLVGYQYFANSQSEASQKPKRSEPTAKA